MFPNKVSIDKASEILKNSPDIFRTFFEHGTLSLELYKPDLIDKQQPHERDEIYIIAGGNARFELENEITEVKTGDFLFVPAKARHRFIDFSNDFST